MKPISTPDAPAAIGTYSQAVRAGDTVYLSGQIALDPKTMQVVEGFENQAKRVFENLQAVCKAAGGDFSKVNEVMATYFKQPYPARAAIGVASLPRGSLVEIDAVMFLG